MNNFLPVFLLLLTACATTRERVGTGDLGVIIEREKGSVQVVETSHSTSVGSIAGLGDLSHASVVFSRDERFAFVFARDGSLSKIDILEKKLVKRVVQGGNSIGGAISQDGRYVAVSNYEPGGVKVFSSETLEQVLDIPAKGENGKNSKTVGLVDIPGQKFAYALFEGNEIWILDISEIQNPKIEKFKNVGEAPYDGFVTNEGRFYFAGLFGENGLSVVDLWNLDKGAKKLIPEFSKEDERLPVYKMPHLEGGSGMGAQYLFIPAVGKHEMYVIDRFEWKLIKKIPLLGQPVFTIASPDSRYVWVNFALPDNHKIQVVDVKNWTVVKEITSGKGVLHMEFTPKGDFVWVSVRDEDRVDIYNTKTFELVKTLKVDKPSGIFFTMRAQRIGL